MKHIITSIDGTTREIEIITLYSAVQTALKIGSDPKIGLELLKMFPNPKTDLTLRKRLTREALIRFQELAQEPEKLQDVAINGGDDPLDGIIQNAFLEQAFDSQTRLDGLKERLYLAGENVVNQLLQTITGEKLNFAGDYDADTWLELLQVFFTVYHLGAKAMQAN